MAKHLEPIFGKIDHQGTPLVPRPSPEAVALAKRRVEEASPRVFVRLRPLADLRSWASTGTAGLAALFLEQILSRGAFEMVWPGHVLKRVVNGIPLEIYPVRWRFDASTVLELAWRQAAWLLDGPYSILFEEVDDVEGRKAVDDAKAAEAKASEGRRPEDARKR